MENLNQGMSDEQKQRAVFEAKANTIIAEKDARIAELEAQVNALIEEVEALSTPAQEAVSQKPKKKGLSGQTFKVGKKEYKLKFPFIHLEGKNYTEEDVLQDKEIQKVLVEMGSGVIEEA